MSSIQGSTFSSVAVNNYSNGNDSTKNTTNESSNKNEQSNKPEKTARVVVKASEKILKKENEEKELSSNNKNKEKATTSKQEKKESESNLTLSDVKFIYNRFTKARGNPKLLQIFSECCQSYIMSYQKDGSGRLLRCYLDRIHHPLSLQQRQFEKFNVKSSSGINCPSCNSLVASPMIYKPENRPAYGLLNGKTFFKEL